jgi:hypothetical protein
MSAAAAALTNEQYEERKLFLDALKQLVKSEQEELFRILKNTKCEFSENSNGVFFDVCKVPADVFESMKKFMDFCRKNRQEFALREQEEKKAQEALYGDATA